MKFHTWKIIKEMTFCICLCATICLSFYSILRFCRNEDVTMVNIAKYHSLEDRIYPSFSFCILPPFLEKEFDRYKHDGINVSSYTKFLKGEIWNESLLQIDYDNVTISLEDNMIVSYYVTQDEKRFTWNPISYVSFRSPSRKCFTIDAPHNDTEMLWSYSTVINNNIFPSGARSRHNKIYTYLHYPGQRLTAYYTVRTEWNSRENMTISYQMIYDIKNVNVVARRNKRKEPCFENWKHYDEYVMENMMVKAGCRPPHWNSSDNMPLCHNSTQMKKFSRQPTTAFVESLIPACKSIDHLDYKYSEGDVATTFGL